MVSDYRLSPALAARLVGLGLMLLALLVFAATLVSALADWPFLVVVLVAVLGLASVGATAYWLLKRAVVLHADDRGYRVRLVRGVGTHEARWEEVEDAVTAVVSGSPCLVLRLRDGRTTTLPVSALAVDREQLVRDVQDRLQAGHGKPPIKRRRR